MASIVTLSKSPEIIYEILQYLSNNDVLSLQRTCKSLYPTCLHQLWSAINLTEGIRPYSGRQIRYTNVEWAQRPGSFACIEQILHFVQDCWVNAPGLAYTKHISFGRFLAGSSDDSRYKISLALGKILENPILNLSTVDLKIDAYDLQLPNISSNTRSLRRLKKYSEKRSLKSFSISLHSKMIHSLVTLIDLEKVTKLTLAPGEWCTDCYRTRCWTARDQEHRQNIDETAQLLHSVPNLTYFVWDGYATGYSLDLLSKIQAAFSAMKHLHTLKIYREFFNKSFFLVPPESVKKLELKCHVSQAWWQAFAECPLTGVEDLHIAPLKYNTNNNLYGVPDDITGPLEPLGDVAVCGLKRFFLSMDGIPPGLEECLFHNNQDLEDDSKTNSLKRSEERIKPAPPTPAQPTPAQPTPTNRRSRRRRRRNRVAESS